MTLVFHLENSQIDFYSGHNLDLEDIVKVCRNFGVYELVIVNESDRKVNILDSLFKWREVETLEQFEKDFNGEIFYMETPWQKKGVELQKVELRDKAVVIGATRGLLKKDNIVNVNQLGVDAFHPKDLIPIVCYEYYLQWRQ